MTLPLKYLFELKVNKFLGLVSDEAVKITYSQFGEDCLVYEVLVNNLRIKNGTYVDIGCFHPRIYSNTRILNLIGWSGANVDANPQGIQLFNKERPMDLNMCYAVVGGVTSKGQTTRYHRFNAAAVNTISEEQAKAWLKNPEWKLQDVVEVPVIGINQLLDICCQRIISIDFLNIDVEGMDRELLLNIDLKKFRPKVIACELHDLDRTNLYQDPVFHRVIESGYRLVSIAHVTYIFQSL